MRREISLFMFSLRECYPNNINITEEFFKDFTKQVKNDGLIQEYFGMLMVIKTHIIKPLVSIAVRYMYTILGMNINQPEVKSFDDATDFGAIFCIQRHKYSGTQLLGFYCSNSKIIYIKDGVHLNKLLPVLFHELTHAFMDQKHIDMEDDYPKPNTLTFSFADQMYIADQNEGFCELVMTLMCFSIFDIEQFPSNVEEYWLGWRLCLESFIFMSKQLSNTKKNINDIERKKIAFDSLINVIRFKNNL